MAAFPRLRRCQLPRGRRCQVPSLPSPHARRSLRCQVPRPVPGAPITPFCQLPRPLPGAPRPRFSTAMAPRDFELSLEAAPPRSLFRTRFFFRIRFQRCHVLLRGGMGKPQKPPRTVVPAYDVKVKSSILKSGPQIPSFAAVQELPKSVTVPELPSSSAVPEHPSSAAVPKLSVKDHT